MNWRDATHSRASGMAATPKAPTPDRPKRRRALGGHKTAAALYRYAKETEA
jgi:hypothetical protein